MKLNTSQHKNKIGENKWKFAYGYNLRSTTQKQYFGKQTKKNKKQNQRFSVLKANQYASKQHCQSQIAKNTILLKFRYAIKVYI